MAAAAAAAPPPRDFVGALSRGPRTRVIAEIKRKSPSAGWMRPEYQRDDFRPEDIAGTYERGGAAAISCLTDRTFFGGDNGYVARVKAVVALPVLRKEFLIDPWQAWESRAIGADAVLLIAECLDDAMLRTTTALARGLGMGVLIESHGEANFRRAMRAAGDDPGVLLGVNNRDLATMRVDLEQTVRLARLAPTPARVVGESGIRTPSDLRRLEEAGVRIVLVGEGLMTRADPGAALRELLAEGTA